MGRNENNTKCDVVEDAKHTVQKLLRQMKENYLLLLLIHRIIIDQKERTWIHTKHETKTKIK